MVTLGCVFVVLLLTVSCSMAAMHVAGASSPAQVPYVEYLVNNQPSKQFFHSPTYVPVNGEVTLPTGPGMGIELDDSKIVDKRDVSFDQPRSGIA